MPSSGSKPPPSSGETGPRDGAALANRKLIRPSLDSAGHWPGTKSERQRRSAAPPQEDTGAEAAHFHKQANMGSRLVVTMEDGEILRGIIEWYDRDCIKLRLEGGPGVLIMKHAILHTATEGKPPSKDQRGRRA